MPPGMYAGTEYTVLTPEEQAALDAAAAEAAAQQAAPAPGLGGGGYEVAPPPAAPPVEGAVPVDPQYQVAPPTDYIPGSTYSPQPIPSQAGAEYGMGPAAATGDPAVEYAAAQPTPIPNNPTAKPYFTETNPYPVSDPNPAPSTLNATAAHGGANQSSGVPYEQGRSNLEVSRQQNERRIYNFQHEQNQPPPVQPVGPRQVSDNGAITLPAGPNMGLGNPADLFVQGADAAERYPPDERQRELEARYAVPPPGTPGTGTGIAAPYNPAVAHASDYLATGAWRNADLPSGETLPTGYGSLGDNIATRVPQGLKDVAGVFQEQEGQSYPIPYAERSLMTGAGNELAIAQALLQGAQDHTPGFLAPIAEFLSGLPAPTSSPGNELTAGAFGMVAGGPKAAADAEEQTTAASQKAIEIEQRQRGAALRSAMTGEPMVPIPGAPDITLPALPPVDPNSPFARLMNTELPGADRVNGAPPILPDWLPTREHALNWGAQAGDALRGAYEQQRTDQSASAAPAPQPAAMPAPPPADLTVGRLDSPPPYDPLSSAYPIPEPSPSLGAQLGQWGGDRLNDAQGALGDYAVSPPNVSLPDLSLPTGGDVRALPGRLSTAIQGLQPPNVSLPGMPGSTPAPADSPDTPAFGWNAARAALEAGGTATNDPLAQTFAEEAAANPASEPLRAGVTEVTGATASGVVMLAGADGQYVGMRDANGTPRYFPDGATDEDKTNLYNEVAAQLAAQIPPAASPTTPAATSESAPIKTIGAEPDYTVEPPADGASTSGSSGGGSGGSDKGYYDAQGTWQWYDDFSKDDYGYDYDARKRSGRSYDSYDDDGAADLTLEDFLKDFDGDGKIGSKDRSMAKKAFMSARAKRGKKAKRSTMGPLAFDPLNRPESPLRTQILDELDAALPKGAPARRNKARE